MIPIWANYKNCFACLIAFDLCFTTSAMLGYRIISPLKLQPAIVAEHGAAKKCSVFLGNNDDQKLCNKMV